MRFRHIQKRTGARLEGWGGPWFETPRTRLHNVYRTMSAAPHHEAGGDLILLEHDIF